MSNDLEARSSTNGVSNSNTTPSPAPSPCTTLSVPPGPVKDAEHITRLLVEALACTSNSDFVRSALDRYDASPKTGSDFDLLHVAVALAHAERLEVWEAEYSFTTAAELHQLYEGCILLFDPSQSDALVVVNWDREVVSFVIDRVHFAPMSEDELFDLAAHLVHCTLTHSIDSLLLLSDSLPMVSVC